MYVTGHMTEAQYQLNSVLVSAGPHQRSLGAVVLRDSVVLSTRLAVLLRAADSQKSSSLGERGESFLRTRAVL